MPEARLDLATSNRGSCVLFNPLSFSSIQKTVGQCGLGTHEHGCEFIFTFSLWKQVGNRVASTSCYKGNAHHYEGVRRDITTSGDLLFGLDRTICITFLNFVLLRTQQTRLTDKWACLVVRGGLGTSGTSAEGRALTVQGLGAGQILHGRRMDTRS